MALTQYLPQTFPDRLHLSKPWRTFCLYGWPEANKHITDKVRPLIKTAITQRKYENVLEQQEYFAETLEMRCRKYTQKGVL